MQPDMSREGQGRQLLHPVHPARVRTRAATRPRRASCSISAAATDTFRDSTMPTIGTTAHASASSSTSSDTPEVTMAQSQSHTNPRQNLSDGSHSRLCPCPSDVTALQVLHIDSAFANAFKGPDTLLGSCTQCSLESAQALGDKRASTHPFLSRQVLPHHSVLVHSTAHLRARCPAQWRWAASSPPPARPPRPPAGASPPPAQQQSAPA